MTPEALIVGQSLQLIFSLGGGLEFDLDLVLTFRFLLLESSSSQDESRFSISAFSSLVEPRFEAFRGEVRTE